MIIPVAQDLLQQRMQMLAKDANVTDVEGKFDENSTKNEVFC